MNLLISLSFILLASFACSPFAGLSKICRTVALIDLADFVELVDLEDFVDSLIRSQSCLGICRLCWSVNFVDCFALFVCQHVDFSSLDAGGTGGDDVRRA